MTVVSLAKRSQAQPLAALVRYPNGALSYVAAPHGLGPGTRLRTWLGFDHFFESRQAGNLLVLKYIRQGDQIFGLYTVEGSRST